MTPELKAKWLEALKSGKYKQTTGRLIRKNEQTDEFSFCCLGVLCEVAGYKRVEGNCAYHYEVELDNSTYKTELYGTLSNRVVAELGLIDADMELLIQTNDSSTSFDNVIQLIETRL